MKQLPLRTAVLISGRGSNLKALADAMVAGKLNMQIVRVVSNREDARGIGHAKAVDIPVSIISHKAYPDRQSHDAAVAEVLQQDRVELVVLAGYMRILGEDITRIFEGRMINLHPSLLPLYRGLDTYNRVLNAGDRFTGASIHFVTAGLDSGPIISQVRIPVYPDDNATSLSARLGPLEHKLVVATIELFCKHEVHCKPDGVAYRGRILDHALQMKHDGTFA